MPHKFTRVDSLLDPPIKRAAYSDRTAWLMAVMSSLAYVRFEQSPPLDELAMSLSKDSDERVILAKLKTLIAAQSREQFKQELSSDLHDLGFELVETYSLSIPLVVDTQAFLARLILPDREPILVLSFRGTEVRQSADIRADIAANPMQVGPEGEGHLVHSGFYKAFKPVEPLIKASLNRPEFKGLPIYITGHSLGGALAITATYCLDSDAVSACYTFGGPRVGNQAFGQSIKTPVYRLVNAADIVPRLPPTYLIEGLTLFLRWLPVVPYARQIADYLEQFRHYRHYGDLRYLTDAMRHEPEQLGLPATYPGLQVLANPSQVLRWFWLYRRQLATFWRSGITDHSIDIYVEKLAAWAILRNR